MCRCRMAIIKPNNDLCIGITSISSKRVENWGEPKNKQFFLDRKLALQYTFELNDKANKHLKMCYNQTSKPLIV